MAEMFSGQWEVAVIEKSAVSGDLSFIIEGSLASDGVYPGETGTPPVSVSGPSWSIRFQLTIPEHVWPLNDVRRTAADYSLENGLTVTIGANSIIRLGEHDFYDLVLLCTNLDPQINPWTPFTNPYAFILPRRIGGPPGSSRD